MQDSKKRLFLIGASHFGREIESWLEQTPMNDRDWELIGFLHTYSGKSPIENYPTDYKIVGEWENYDYMQDDLCLITISDCSWKEKIYLFLKDKVTFFTFIHPSVIMGKSNRIAEGTILCPNVILTTNISVGKCVMLNIGTQCGHDVKIGDYSSLMSQVEIGGKVEIGKKVFIGSHANIIPDIKIDDESIVGAGSVVIKKVKKGETVFGNPARRIVT